MKNAILLKWHNFTGNWAYLRYGESEGRKSSALYQNPRSTHFSCFLDIIPNTFFYKTIPIILNWTLSPLWGTRRDKIERPLSPGVVATSFVFSRHHTKNVFLLKPYLLSWIGPYLLYVEPEGTKSNALYHMVWWTLFQYFLDIIWFFSCLFFSTTF